jgi:hypothetical protein
VDAEGTPFEVSPRIHRRIVFMGSSDAYCCFCATAEQAGHCIAYAGNFDVIRSDSLATSDAINRWMLVLFDFALSRPFAQHSALSAYRGSSLSAAIEVQPLVEGVPQNHGQSAPEPERFAVPDEDDAPWWVSWLNLPFDASIEAIDHLLVFSRI